MRFIWCLIGSEDLLRTHGRSKQWVGSLVLRNVRLLSILYPPPSNVIWSAAPKMGGNQQRVELHLFLPPTMFCTHISLACPQPFCNLLLLLQSLILLSLACHLSETQTRLLNWQNQDSKHGLALRVSSQTIGITFGNPGTVLSTTQNWILWYNKHRHGHNASMMSGSSQVAEGWPMLSVCSLLVLEMSSFCLQLIDFVSCDVIVSRYFICIHMTLVILSIFLSPLITAFLSNLTYQLHMHTLYILHCAVCTQCNFNTNLGPQSYCKFY